VSQSIDVTDARHRRDGEVRVESIPGAGARANGRTPVVESFAAGSTRVSAAHAAIHGSVQVNTSVASERPRVRTDACVRMSWSLNEALHDGPARVFAMVRVGGHVLRPTVTPCPVAYIKNDNRQRQPGTW
jgi:hypothetical protein